MKQLKARLSMSQFTREVFLCKSSKTCWRAVQRCIFRVLSKCFELSMGNKLKPKRFFSKLWETKTHVWAWITRCRSQVRLEEGVTSHLWWLGTKRVIGSLSWIAGTMKALVHAGSAGTGYGQLSMSPHLLSLSYLADSLLWRKIRIE